jgi:hypothetical protein
MNVNNPLPAFLFEPIMIRRMPTLCSVEGKKIKMVIQMLDALQWRPSGCRDCLGHHSRPPIPPPPALRGTRLPVPPAAFSRGLSISGVFDAQHEKVIGEPVVLTPAFGSVQQIIESALN